MCTALLFFCILFFLYWDFQVSKFGSLLQACSVENQITHAGQSAFCKASKPPKVPQSAFVCSYALIVYSSYINGGSEHFLSPGWKEDIRELFHLLTQIPGLCKIGSSDMCSTVKELRMFWAISKADLTDDN